MTAKHYIETVDPKLHVEQTIHVILADNSVNNVESTGITNYCVVGDLHLRSASTALDIAEDFGIDIALDQIRDFETVGDLVMFVENSLKGDDHA